MICRPHDNLILVASTNGSSPPHRVTPVSPCLGTTPEENMAAEEDFAAGRGRQKQTREGTDNRRYVRG